MSVLLFLQCSNIERQHAVIEYNESEGCFVVQDLNSAHGTYVNECRVQNAAVRLASGDVIRFGYGILYYCRRQEEPAILISTTILSEMHAQQLNV